MASLTTFLTITMLSFNVTTLVIASTCHSSCIMMATTADTVNTFSMASAGHHSLDGFRHYSAPAAVTSNNDSTPLQLMIITLPIVFCHNIYLHQHRFVLPSDEPSSSTNIFSTSVTATTSIPGTCHHDIPNECPPNGFKHLPPDKCSLHDSITSHAAAFSSKVIPAVVEWIDRPDVNTGSPLMTNFAFNGFLLMTFIFRASKKLFCVKLLCYFFQMTLLSF